MKRIGEGWEGDEGRFGGPLAGIEPYDESIDAMARPGAARVVASAGGADTNVAIDKAVVVLRALSAAGLRKPYDFNLEEAKKIWATQIGQFSLDELTEAVRDWIAVPDQDFPAVGDVVAVCNKQRRDKEQERRVTEARDWGGCQECSDNKWVRVYGPVIKTDIAKGMEKYGVADGTVVETRSHMMRPCSMCPDMRHAWELFSTSHFSAEHISSGGCKQCRDYHEPWRPRKIS